MRRNKAGAYIKFYSGVEKNLMRNVIKIPRFVSKYLLKRYI